MDILVFSDNPEVAESFRLKKGGRPLPGVQTLPVSELRRALGAAQGPVLCYLDVSGLSRDRLRECRRLLGRCARAAYGLLDPGRTITDVAEVFHQGAVDYLDGSALQGGLTAPRLKRIRGYLEGVNPRMLRPPNDPGSKANAGPYVESGSDWAGLIHGREYTFCHVFIELDGKELMQKKYGVENLSTALGSFRSYVEGFVKPYLGKVWFWARFGGIVLFPFDGTTNQALSCVFRLMLFKHFYDIESSLFPNFLSFRVAMHLGNLVWLEADPGNLVSDSLNTVFHLGQQFAKPGNAYATRQVLERGPRVLRAFFTDPQTFEGRRILRMRLPLHGS